MCFLTPVARIRCRGAKRPWGIWPAGSLSGRGERTALPISRTEVGSAGRDVPGPVPPSLRKPAALRFTFLLAANLRPNVLQLLALLAAPFPLLLLKQPEAAMIKQNGVREIRFKGYVIPRISYFCSPPLSSRSRSRSRFRSRRHPLLFPWRDPQALLPQITRGQRTVMTMDRAP